MSVPITQSRVPKGHQNAVKTGFIAERRRLKAFLMPPCVVRELTGLAKKLRQFLTPALFDVWMRLLRQVEGSVLWLLQTGELAMRNLRREAAERGVEPARLVFAP